MTLDRGKVDAALRNSIFVSALDFADRERLISSAQAKSWRSGEPIFCMGDIGTSMMLVMTGVIRISYPASDGRSVILCELGPGAVLGEITLLDGGERSADATAITNCTLLVFERRLFLELLQNNWPLAEAIVKLVCSRLRSSDRRMADLAFYDLPGRLAKALLSRGRPAPVGGQLRVSDTQGALAALVGGSRESVNRCLRKWERDGLVALVEGRVSILDSERLRQLYA